MITEPAAMPVTANFAFSMLAVRVRSNVSAMPFGTVSVIAPLKVRPSTSFMPSLSARVIR